MAYRRPSPPACASRIARSIAVCGDGGFAMTMNELETAVREGAHPIAIVFDNLRYGTIEMHQRRRGSQPVATDLGPIDFAAVATACGALGLRVTRQTNSSPPCVRLCHRAARPSFTWISISAGCRPTQSAARARSHRRRSLTRRQVRCSGLEADPVVEAHR
jgi:thiamine pyrophosphate-dependent acetolactate synthase large subunit-like protein